MKGKKLLVVLAFVALFTACNLTIPTSMKFKTAANYNFTVAKLDFKLSDYYSPENLIPTDENSPFKIYDYNPADNTEGVQQLLLRMPIQEIPLDFSEYMANTSFGDSLEAMSFNQEIEVPKAVISVSESISADDVNTLLNSLVAIVGKTNSSVEVEIQGGGFKTIEYKEGEFGINVEAETSGKVQLVKVNPSTEELIEVIGEGILVPNAGQSVAIIPMNGKTLYGNQTRLWFDSTVPKTVNFEAGMLPTSKIKKITGLTCGELTEIPFNQTIDGSSLGSTINYIKFGADSTFNMKYKTPSAWKGITFTQSINLTGGMNCSISETDAVPYSLENVMFTPSDIEAAITVKIIANDATITFDSDVSIDVSVDVKTLKEVAIKIDDVSTSFDVNQKLPEEATSLIKSIIWNKGTGIKITYTNTFPAGNDFILSDVKSDFIGLPKTSGTIEGGKSKTQFAIATPAETSSIFKPHEDNFIDFSGELLLPGGSTDKIIMKNVVAGTKYTLDIKIEPVLDWKAITINSEATRVNQSTSIDFNKAAIFKEVDNQFGTTLGDHFELSSMPVYLFCDVPNLTEAFDNPKFNGTISACLEDKDGNPIDSSGNVSLLDNADMPFCKEPKLVFDEKNVLKTKITGPISMDFAPLINNSTEDSKITVKFDVKFTTGKDSSAGDITIEKSKLSKMTSTSIYLTADIVIPLDFNITGADQRVDLMKLSGADEKADLFDRTEAPKKSKIDDILFLVKDVEVFFQPEKKVFISSNANPISVNIDIDGIGTDYEEQVIGLNGGSFHLGDPKDILYKYPIKPSASLVIPAGRIAIPRDAGLTTPIRLSVYTDGEVNLFGGE